MTQQESTGRFGKRKPRYRTSDHVLVAYLAVNLIYHEDISHTGKNVYWYFDDSAALQEHVAKFAQREAQVEPIAFAAASRQTQWELDNYKRNSDDFPRYA
ncbi:MAG TPA: DUF5659 domain-containing protein [Ktedonobacteraceae bacterium]